MAPENPLPFEARIADEFRSTIAGYDLSDLEDHSGTIIGLCTNLRLRYLNPAWFRFAHANGGEPRISREWPLGRAIADCWQPPFGALYGQRYRKCLRSGRVWTHEYECSDGHTPRCFHQIVYPLHGGLLVVHAESVGIETSTTDMLARYADTEGLITQCMYCRRINWPTDAQRWDWVEAWATNFPSATSHGLCPTCHHFYYPPLDR